MSKNIAECLKRFEQKQEWLNKVDWSLTEKDEEWAGDEGEHNEEHGKQTRSRTTGKRP
jgi:hypothetical protein